MTSVVLESDESGAVVVFETTEEERAARLAEWAMAEADGISISAGQAETLMKVHRSA